MVGDLEPCILYEGHPHQEHKEAPPEPFPQEGAHTNKCRARGIPPLMPFTSRHKKGTANYVCWLFVTKEYQGEKKSVSKKNLEFLLNILGFLRVLFNKRIVNIALNKSFMYLPHYSLKLLVHKRNNSVFYLFEFRFSSCKAAELKLPSTRQTVCFRGRASKVFLTRAESTLWHLWETLHYLQWASYQRQCLAKSAYTMKENTGSALACTHWQCLLKKGADRTA